MSLSFPMDLTIRVFIQVYICMTGSMDENAGNLASSGVLGFENGGKLAGDESSVAELLAAIRVILAGLPVSSS
jgi:hypothetical protein